MRGQRTYTKFFERRSNTKEISFNLNLRDYFAACALSGMQANIGANKWSKFQFVHEAYEYADAMLEERKKEEK